MSSRIWKLTIVEGEGPKFVGVVKGPEGTWLRNQTTGQQGVTNVALIVYERSSSTAPATQVYSATLATATVIPYASGASGPGITGDGWTNDPEGYNFLYLEADGEALYTMSGGHVYLYEFRFLRTGATNGQDWGDLVLPVEVTVLSRYGG